MTQNEAPFEQVTVPIAPWDKKCQHFAKVVLNPENILGLTPTEVGELAITICKAPPQPNPTHDEQGNELEYWQKMRPICPIHLLVEQVLADQNMARYSASHYARQDLATNPSI